MADDLSDMSVFVRIVDAGSLSDAARRLNLSLAVVSRRLSQLEDRLGVRLANRTTRTLSMTEEGHRFYDRCVRILAEVEEAKMEAMSGKDNAIGRLRITTTLAFGTKHLGPLLADFAKLHPRLTIYLNASDNITNLVESGYDLAVRFGALADSNLISRQMARNARVICASPEYLARHGTPAVMEDLLRHECIVYGEPPLDTWTSTDGRSVVVAGRIATSSGVLAHELALTGEGLVLKSIWDVYEDLAAGRLQIVLPDLKLAAAPIHALFPHGKLAAAKVRLCVDYLAARLKERAARIPAISAVP